MPQTPLFLIPPSSTSSFSSLLFATLEIEPRVSPMLSAQPPSYIPAVAWFLLLFFFLSTWHGTQGLAHTKHLRAAPQPWLAQASSYVPRSVSAWVSWHQKKLYCHQLFQVLSSWNTLKFCPCLALCSVMHFSPKHVGWVSMLIKPTEKTSLLPSSSWKVGPRDKDKTRNHLCGVPCWCLWSPLGTKRVGTPEHPNTFRRRRVNGKPYPILLVLLWVLGVHLASGLTLYAW